MVFQEIHFKIGDGESRAVIMAMLESIGFESFIEADEELIGYIPPDDYSTEKIKEVLKSVDSKITFTVHSLEQKNWNEEWEKNYPPVVVNEKCYIRAPFHPERKEYPIEIIIEPRMAFGTAHHETTALMIEWLLEKDLSNKSVLDMGCGTGVLAILANKLGASSVMAVDNDEWAYLNTLDNIMLNNTGNCSAYYDDVSAIKEKLFDVIIANINRNILLEDIPAYSKSLIPGGQMFLSGFYEQDVKAITNLSTRHELALSGMKSRAGWASLCFRKNIP